ncbi:uncharacterized protein [Nicotiana sylvestris]|uniref:uncharacterized protein n=1 Tax=Nicotiana sylvestris TaxID=4096 RepID=UPI00388CD92D
MAGKEMEVSVIDPPREEEESESGLKEELHKLKHQYQAWMKGNPPPSCPANPAFIPPLAKSQEPPVVELSPQHAPSFTPYHHYHGTTSQTIQALPAKTTTYPPLPATPIFVAPPPSILHRSSSEPVFQAQDNQYYTPERTFKVLDHLYLTKIEKNPSKSFMEYGFRWKEQAARVDPPMKENEMVDCFLQTLEPTYFGHLVSAVGHDTEKCWHLKSAIQENIDTNQIKVERPEVPHINKNPLPAHVETHIIEIVYKDGKPEKPSKSVMMIRASENNLIKTLIVTNATSSTVEGLIDKISKLDAKPSVVGVKELGKAKTLKDSPILVKKPVTEEEAEEFLRKMKVQDYSIMEQLRKTPAQISLLSLLIHSNEHRWALMNILNEAHVPDKITVNHLEKIANKIFESNRITFSDDELPLEGTKHNRALYLTVKCEDSIITRVLVANSSNANIFPLSTLHKLKIDAERIHKNNICVRGFDGGERALDTYCQSSPILSTPDGKVRVGQTRDRCACSFYASFNDMTCMRNLQPGLKSQSNSEIIIQEIECDDETKYDEEEVMPFSLNPAKCAFGVPFGKLLGFIFSRRGIELDLSMIKAIQEIATPKE